MEQYADFIFFVVFLLLFTLFAYLLNKADFILQTHESSNWKAGVYLIQFSIVILLLFFALITALIPTESPYKTVVIVCAFVGLLFLTTPVRKIISNFIPIQPLSHVHTFALLMSVFIPMTLFQALVDPTSLADIQEEEITFAFSISTLWGQNILFALFAIIGVGFLSKRNWQQTKERLGLHRLTPTQLGTGIAVAGLLFLLQWVLTIVLTALGLSPDEEILKVNNALMSPLFNNPIGILSIGLAAALGEELIFRGALQPRFGIVLTSALFALMHSNYGLTLATIVVLALGFALGICRQRVSTTYAMLVHASYNILIGIIGHLFP